MGSSGTIYSQCIDIPTEKGVFCYIKIVTIENAKEKMKLSSLFVGTICDIIEFKQAPCYFIVQEIFGAFITEKEEGAI